MLMVSDVHHARMLLSCSAKHSKAWSHVADSTAALQSLLYKCAMLAVNHVRVASYSMVMYAALILLFLAFPVSRVKQDPDLVRHMLARTRKLARDIRQLVCNESLGKTQLTCACCLFVRSFSSTRTKSPLPCGLVWRLWLGWAGWPAGCD